MSFLTKLFWVISFVASVVFPALGFVLMLYTVSWTMFEFVVVAVVDAVRRTHNGN